MRLEGVLRVGAPPELCLERLRDPSWLRGCLPNLTSLEQTGGGEFRAVFHLDLSEIARVADYLARIRVEMRFTYMDAGPAQVVLRGVGRVVGARVTITISVDVQPADGGGSLLRWSSDVELGIIERLLGGETVRRVAERQINALTNCLRGVLGGDPRD